MMNQNKDILSSKTVLDAMRERKIKPASFAVWKNAMDNDFEGTRKLLEGMEKDSVEFNDDDRHYLTQLTMAHLFDKEKKIEMFNKK